MTSSYSGTGNKPSDGLVVDVNHPQTMGRLSGLSCGEGVGTKMTGSNVLTGVTQSGSPACLMAWHVERRRPFPRQIRETLKVEA